MIDLMWMSLDKMQKEHGKQKGQPLLFKQALL